MYYCVPGKKKARVRVPRSFDTRSFPARLLNLSLFLFSLLPMSVFVFCVSFSLSLLFYTRFSLSVSMIPSVCVCVASVSFQCLPSLSVSLPPASAFLPPPLHNPAANASGSLLSYSFFVA